MEYYKVRDFKNTLTSRSNYQEKRPQRLKTDHIYHRQTNIPAQNVYLNRCYQHSFKTDRHPVNQYQNYNRSTVQTPLQSNRDISFDIKNSQFRPNRQFPIQFPFQSRKLQDSLTIPDYSNQSPQNNSPNAYKSREQMLFQKIVEKRKILKNKTKQMNLQQKNQFSNEKSSSPLKSQLLLDSSLKLNHFQQTVSPNLKDDKGQFDNSFRKRIFWIKQKIEEPEQQRLAKLFEKNKLNSKLLEIQSQKALKKTQNIGIQTDKEVDKSNSQVLIQAELFLNISKKNQIQFQYRCMEAWIQQINILLNSFKSYTGIQLADFIIMTKDKRDNQKFGKFYLKQFGQQFNGLSYNQKKQFNLEESEARYYNSNQLKNQSSLETPKFSEARTIEQAFTRSLNRSRSQKTQEQSLLLWLGQSITKKSQPEQMLLSESDHSKSQGKQNSQIKKYEKSLNNCYTFRNIPLDDMKNQEESKSNLSEIEYQINTLLHQNNIIIDDYSNIKLQCQEMKNIIRDLYLKQKIFKQEIEELNKQLEFSEEQITLMRHSLDDVKNTNKGLLIKVRQITHEKERVQQSSMKMKYKYNVLINSITDNGLQDNRPQKLQKPNECFSQKFALVVQGKQIWLNQIEIQKVLRNYETVLQFFGVEIGLQDYNQVLIDKISNFHNQIMSINHKLLQLQDQLSQAQKQEKTKRQSIISSQRQNKENNLYSYLFGNSESLKTSNHNSTKLLLIQNGSKVLKNQKSCTQLKKQTIHLQFLTTS